MANSLTQNPFYIDTAGATSIFEGGRRLFVKQLRWVSASAVAGHKCTIKRADGTGNPIWDEVAPGANFSSSELIEQWFQNGMQVTVLDSGVLYVHIG